MVTQSPFDLLNCNQPSRELGPSNVGTGQRQYYLTATYHLNFSFRPPSATIMGLLNDPQLEYFKTEKKNWVSRTYIGTKDLPPFFSFHIKIPSADPFDSDQWHPLQVQRVRAHGKAPCITPVGTPGIGKQCSRSVISMLSYFREESFPRVLFGSGILL